MVFGFVETVVIKYSFKSYTVTSFTHSQHLAMVYSLRRDVQGIRFTCPLTYNLYLGIFTPPEPYVFISNVRIKTVAFK